VLARQRWRLARQEQARCRSDTSAELKELLAPYHGLAALLCQGCVLAVAQFSERAYHPYRRARTEAAQQGDCHSWSRPGPHAGTVDPYQGRRPRRLRSQALLAPSLYIMIG
jgi:hypothetical protein